MPPCRREIDRRAYDDAGDQRPGRHPYVSGRSARTGSEPPEVPTADVATVDVADLTGGDPATRRHAVAELGESLVETGFVKVAGHAVDPARLAAAYAAAGEAFALADDRKSRYVRPELAGARGLVPFGREKAK